MAALDCVNGYLAFAERTNLCCGLFFLFFFVLVFGNLFAECQCLIDRLNDTEYYQRHNQEVDDCRNECAVVDVVVAYQMKLALNFRTADAVDDWLDNVVGK